MEWLVLGALSALAALAVARAPVTPSHTGAEVDVLSERYQRLIQELRDLDEDAEAGRISSDERTDGRRALAPELRATFEAMRANGVTS